MPQAKYRRRSQRNRRREGSAKYVALDIPITPNLTQITVTGAGETAVNGIYTWDNTTGFWVGPAGNSIQWQPNVFNITDGINVFYDCPSTYALPVNSGWVQGTGALPLPTISYTG